MAESCEFLMDIHIGISTLQIIFANFVKQYAFISVLLGILLLLILFQSRILKDWRSCKKLMVKGTTTPGFEDVKRAFQDILDYGWEQGGAFTVYHKGKQVVNIWGGYADPGAGPSEWKKDTLARFFSCAKGVSAICLAMLADKGLIDYNEKVSHYWPEFGQNGKEEITVKQLVSLQGGVALLSKPHYLQWHRDDYPRLRTMLEEQPPLWPPGSAYGYHAFTHALYIDELIRRVDTKHRPLHQFFKEEIADVHGIDFHIGLPLSQAYRMSRLGVSPRGLWVPFTHIKFLYEQIFKIYLWRLLLNIKDITGNLDASFNDPNFMNIGIGSTHGFGTAESLAKFYSIVMNTDGTCLSKSMIEDLQKPVVSGKDEVLGYSWTWGLGVCLFKITENNKEYFVIGSAGHGGQIGFADTENQLGVAFVSRCLWPYSDATPDRRYIYLLKVLYRCILRIEGRPDSRIELLINN